MPWHWRAQRWRDPESLGAKLALILTAAGLIGALAITLLLAAVITPSFNRLEQQVIHAHIERTAAVLREYGSKVEMAVHDYGDWDAGYAYMAHPTGAFGQERLSPLAMSNLGVQGMAYLAPDGRLVIARWLQPGTQRERPDQRARLIAALGRISLQQALHGGGSGHFFMRVGDEVAAVGVAQVRRSDGTGAPRGWVLMARVLTSRRVADLPQLDARIQPPGARIVTIGSPSRSLADIRVPIVGLDGHPVATLRFGVRRDVSLLGRRMLLLAVAGSIVLLLIVLSVLRRMIAQQVLKPLHHVEAHMQRVRASGSLALLDEDGRRDEIGSLGRSFNAMLRQLNDLREQIEVQSFALGRSESAVAVMHNVRNALNPVSTILSQEMSQPPVDTGMLNRALAELAREDVPAARRAKLTAFVTVAVDAWSTGREAMKRELAVGREAMAHALEIIGQQQHQAHERPPLETCDVTEIVARNAIIARYSQHAAIALSFPGTPHRVLASRVILSQVIGNLLGNAAEAIAARGTGSGTIAVTVAARHGRVVVSIRDDGEGFDGDVGQALFQRGFSTRRHKSGGLGLHWCANSMTAMDGSLRLESAGRGRGAVAILTLKAAAAEPRAEAA
ncbi:CHASE4 domain-containing protein [Sphingomonas sp.]|uniref:CHASE4 domain-containing protein n=1 Tax=Sphingomonas sp. TaxID=28214 RepID=UPI003CC6C56F